MNQNDGHTNERSASNTKIEEKPVFSIVMPVYNTEKYLPAAIRSVQNQTFGDFELLLIDDASSDGCAALCDRAAQQDKRIRVIHEAVNKGVSNARNRGIDEANGNYLMFMDSDDYIDDSLLLEARRSIGKNKAQIIFFGLTEEIFDIHGNHVESIATVPGNYCFKEAAHLRGYLLELEKMRLYGYAVNKFYDLSYLRVINIKYKEYPLLEDCYFNIRYCMDIDSMNVLSNSAYHYRKNMNSQSRTGKYVPEYYRLHRRKVHMLYNQFNYWNENNDLARGTLGAIYARYIFSALSRNCDKRAGMNLRRRYRWLHYLYDEQLFNDLIPSAESESLKTRLLIICLKYRLTFLSLGIGRVIYLIKNCIPGVFHRIQKVRVGAGE